ncbi:hypothetical protein F4777DRAFT_567352 [Nemania sp. FL0916]|nr:hypothetical protein F4777DRAFT_567352 [Nemania sp. FL0916]
MLDMSDSEYSSASDSSSSGPEEWAPYGSDYAGAKGVCLHQSDDVHIQEQFLTTEYIDVHSGTATTNTDEPPLPQNSPDAPSQRPCPRIRGAITEETFRELRDEADLDGMNHADFEKQYTNRKAIEVNRDIRMSLDEFMRTAKEEMRLLIEEHREARTAIIGINQTAQKMIQGGVPTNSEMENLGRIKAWASRRKI